MNIEQLSPHPAIAIAARLEGVLRALTQLIFARFHLFGDLAQPLHNRIARARQRLVALLANLAAGREPRPHTPRPGRKGGPRGPSISTRRAWLVHVMGHHAGAYASQLQFLLHEPDTLALLAAAPPRALSSVARTLRPLCRMLGVPLPPLLQPPAKPPRPPRPRPVRPKPLPRMTVQSCLPQRRPRDMPFLRPAANFRRT